MAGLFLVTEIAQRDGAVTGQPADALRGPGSSTWSSSASTTQVPGTTSKVPLEVSPPATLTWLSWLPVSDDPAESARMSWGSSSSRRALAPALVMVPPVAMRASELVS